MGDKAAGQRRAVKETFPGVPVLMCLFHTMQTIDREITTRKMQITNDQREKSKDMIIQMLRSYSEEEYSNDLLKFCSEAPEEVFTYFEKNWHRKKDDWTKYGMTSKGNLGNYTNNGEESTNARIKKWGLKLSSLPDFLGE